MHQPAADTAALEPAPVAAGRLRITAVRVKRSLAAAIEQPEQAQTATRTLTPELVVPMSCGAGGAAEGGKASTQSSNQKQGPGRVQP